MAAGDSLLTGTPYFREPLNPGRRSSFASQAMPPHCRFPTYPVIDPASRPVHLGREPLLWCGVDELNQLLGLYECFRRGVNLGGRRYGSFLYNLVALPF